METLIQLNTTRNGRDKVFRTLQYALKAINGSLPYLASEKSRDLEKTLASFRKLLRLGTFIDALHGARQSIHHADLLHGSLITLSRIANAMYLLGDHIIWLHKVQCQLIILSILRIIQNTTGPNIYYCLMKRVLDSRINSEILPRVQ